MAKCPTCGQDRGPTEERWFGDRPYGLMPDPRDPRESAINYEEVATIDTICSRHRAGDSIIAIVKWMNGTRVRTRCGGTWSAVQVKRILVRAGLV